MMRHFDLFHCTRDVVDMAQTLETRQSGYSNVRRLFSYKYTTLKDVISSLLRISAHNESIARVMRNVIVKNSVTDVSLMICLHVVKISMSIYAH